MYWYDPNTVVNYEPNIVRLLNWIMSDNQCNEILIPCPTTGRGYHNISTIYIYISIYLYIYYLYLYLLSTIYYLYLLLYLWWIETLWIIPYVTLYRKFTHYMYEHFVKKKRWYDRKRVLPWQWSKSFPPPHWRLYTRAASSAYYSSQLLHGLLLLTTIPHNLPPSLSVARLSYWITRSFRTQRTISFSFQLLPIPNS